MNTQSWAQIPNQLVLATARGQCRTCGQHVGRVLVSAFRGCARLWVPVDGQDPQTEAYRKHACPPPKAEAATADRPRQTALPSG